MPTSASSTTPDPGAPPGEDAPPDDAPPALATDGEEHDAPRVLLVEVDDRRLAVAMAHVREVAPAAMPTPVPGTPPWVTGVAAVRGTVMPVADVRLRPQHGAVRTRRRDAWVVVLVDGARAAAIAGARLRTVEAVGATEDDDGGSGPAGLPVRGLVRLRDREGLPPVPLLDAAALLDEILDGG